MAIRRILGSDSESDFKENSPKNKRIIVHILYIADGVLQILSIYLEVFNQYKMIQANSNLPKLMKRT